MLCSKEKYNTYDENCEHSIQLMAKTGRTRSSSEARIQNEHKYWKGNSDHDSTQWLVPGCALCCILSKKENMLENVSNFLTAYIARRWTIKK